MSDRREDAGNPPRKKKKRKKKRPEAPLPPLGRVHRVPLPQLGPAEEARKHGRLFRAIGAAGLTLLVIAGALLYPWLARGTRWFNIGWHYIWVLLLLAAVPLVWWWGTYGQDRRKPHLRIGTALPLMSGPRGWRVRLRDLPGILRAVAVGLFVVALAGPVAILSDETSKESGIDIVIVMDLSGSMKAIMDADPKDLPQGFEIGPNRRITRLEVAKMVVMDFIERRKTDRIGAVVFGKEAYILSPPTLDYQLLSKLVSKLSIHTIDYSGTAIGDALGTAVARMRRSEALSKVVILLTDGDNNAGKIQPEYAIELANAVGCRVNTIQIGDESEVEVLEGYQNGVPIYDRKRYPTNPALLKKIADKTGGEAFIATDAKALRDSMHSILDQLEKTQFEASIGHQEDLFPLLLFPGVVLIGLDALLRALLIRRFP